MGEHDHKCTVCGCIWEHKLKANEMCYFLLYMNCLKCTEKMKDQFKISFPE